MLLRTLIALPLIAALAGCSSAYDVRAVVIGGKLAFVPAKTGISGEPDCIYSVSVSTVDRSGAAATKADDAPTVLNGIYWDMTFAVTSCENPFPVFYGAKLKGPPFGDVEGYKVEAKPLRIGAVYQVSTASEGSAYGGGEFLITEERKVVNLPR